jgi:hypothetical protein
MIDREAPVPRVGAKRLERGGRPQKYFLSDHGRKIINERYDGSSARIDELEKCLGVPRWVICKWASQMNLTRPSRDRNWTQKEMDFLKGSIGSMGIAEIALQLHRGYTAVRLKAIHLGLYKPNDEDGYSLADLRAGFGVNHHKIYKWVEQGWLKGKKQRMEIAHDVWHFSARDIREFIFAHPGELDPRKFDWLWIADIMAGDRGLGALDNPRDR